jgi:hypothetical protein
MVWEYYECDIKMLLHFLKPVFIPVVNILMGSSKNKVFNYLNLEKT